MPDQFTPRNAPPLLVGQFRFVFADESWEWSAETAQIHGYPATEMRPSTALVMSHKHPADHAKIAATLAEIRRTHGPINTRHRIVDRQGRTHEIIVVGVQMRDELGNVVGNQGFFVDVSPTGHPLDQVDDAQRLITEAVAEIAEQRGVIEQCKGILMFVYRIDAERAFDLLRWRSQVTNTKLRGLAAQYLAEFTTLDGGKVMPTRLDCDRLLLTAHERIESQIAS
ncbi:ANTAR domain-containing protein [Mycobacterium hodleri]|uniref:PAS and ANTAR domain-containing protein n=1 Tax=Mycolicibacterium hodleri TaxID=49897 RepID=UPI0021F2D484|nr:PAS and ANTAR domain-containing protein [Mycolicibacterium hodleri]MCV7135271.1 ANTAR domain-containing protein [Mycolicibacterium hodleri]